MKLDRLDALRDFLYANGTCPIDALAEAVGTSIATVRRDIHLLEKQGVVSRTYGGARLATGAGVELAFEVRERRSIAEKRAIARAALALVRPQSAIFLDAGTTVLQLARLLRVDPMPLAVFTNSIAVAQELMHVSKLRVTLLGGAVRSENASVTGPAAEAMLDRLWFDQLFLGVSAVGDDGCIYSLDPTEASLNERMLTRAAAVTILADSSKFGRRSTHRVAPITPPMRVLSDDGLSTPDRRRLADAGVDCILASLRPTTALRGGAA